MSPSAALTIAQALLAIHIAAALFIISGMLIIPIGIAGRGHYAVPLIHSVGYRVVHVPLPFSATTVVYTAALLLLLFWWFQWPPGLRRNPRR